MRVSEISRLFLAWVGERRSENTLLFYAGRLKAFTETFGGLKAKRLTLQAIESHLLAVNQWPDGTAKAPDTQRGNIVAIEQWQKFALNRGMIKQAILRDVEKPLGRRRERLPTAAEVDQIKANCSQAFRLIYQALRQCGARPNELARATVADWDQIAGVIVLTKHKTARKTGRPRKISVGEKLRQILTESLNGRTDGPLFLTPRGKPWTAAALSQAFARARRKAGVDSTIVLYSARHEHATAICAILGIEAAADALGHESVDTTRRHYAHKSLTALQANQDAVCL